MTSEFLEKMEQWHMLVTMITGMDFEELDIEYHDDDGYFDEDNLISALEGLYRIRAAKENPTPRVQAALRTMEMGITSGDIGTYLQHLAQVEEAKRVEREREALLNHPFMVKLARANFAFVESDVHPDHTHFEFDMPNKGPRVHGRIVRASWNSLRVWFTWTDGKNKKHKQVWKTGAVSVPRAAPGALQQWGHTRDSKCIAQIAAYHCITPGNMQKLGLICPSK